MNVETKGSLLNVRETARRLGVHENTVRNWAKAGILPEARVPGSRFHRFREADVNRLLKQRGKVTPTLQADRRTIGPELVDASQLNAWATTRPAQDRCPELIRRLLAATPGITSIVVRSGDGVALSGWDGTADSVGTPYLPAGALRLELGVGGQPKSKADEDWKNRAGAEPSNETFVFVTPRRWSSAQAWAKARRAERKFADVRVLDGDVLEGWLQATPSVHYWISEELGRRPRNAVTIEHWWDRFSATTDPQLPVDLFVAGRSDQRSRLLEHLDGSARVTTIRSEWAEDCKAFIYAATRGRGDDHDPRPILVVSSSTVWDRVTEQPGRAVLIPTFESPAIATAISSGHHVLLVVDRSVATGEPADIDLPRLERRAAAEAFQAASVDFARAQQYAGAARRNLASFIRSLSRDPRIAQPLWAKPPLSRILGPVVLVGRWTTSDGDIEAVEQVVGKPWNEIEEAVLAVSGTTDPVFRKVGQQWSLTSPSEAFILLSDSLTATDVKRWRESFAKILLEPDPVLDLSTEDRALAGIRGIRRRHSHTLREGLAHGAALMGTLGDTTYVDAQTSLASAAESGIRQVLEVANDETTGRQWHEMSGLLPLLAEAAPQDFLDAVENDLQRSTPVLRSLFQDAQDSSIPIFGPSSPHPHLLWALETVCWSGDYLIDGVRALSRLAAIDPGGKTTNRPLHSLGEVLCGWVRGTSASFEERVRALDVIRQIAPDVCWDLIINLWPTNHGVAMPPASPRLRDWRPNDTSVPMAEWVEFVHVLVRHALELVGADPARIEKLAEGIATVPTTDQSLILKYLETVLSAEAVATGDRLTLWESLHKLVLRHQRFSTAAWALSPDALTRLAAAVDSMEPSDDPQRQAYLFDWRPDLPDVDDDDLEEYDARLHQLQSDAIGQILARPDSFEALTQLAARVPVPQHLGWVLAESNNVVLANILPWLQSADPALRDAAANWVRRNALLNGSDWFAEILDNPILVGEPRNLVINSAPASGRIWSEIGRRPSDASQYWQTTPVEFVESKDVNEAVDQLCRHGRAWAAIKVVANGFHGAQRANDPAAAAPEDDLVVRVLDQAIEEVPGNHDVSSMTGHYIGVLLDHLESSGTPTSTIARYEFAYYRLLEHTRAPRSLNTALAASSEIFVDLVKRVYRAKDAEATEASENQRAMANQAWWVLKGWTGFPGRNDDGTVDGDLMRSWVIDARLALSDAGRADIGDEVIGQAFAHSPIGLDGAWPAEPIRDLVETIGSRELENGIALGRINSRGVTTRGPYDGGAQERALADQYRAWSQQINVRWRRTSRILRDLAESYDHDARREDVEAEISADRD
jgi:excisionase family DNA binding protein